MNGLRCVWRQAVQHKLRGLPSGKTAVYVAEIFHYRVKEAERTWKHSQHNRIVKGRNRNDVLSRALDETETIALCSSALLSFFLFLFSLSSAKGIRYVGECRFWFSFLFFFTCFSNARWKIPTRRVGVRVDHPFPWFWQLLAFVSAMEVVLDVCFYLRASFDLSLILEFYLFPSTRFPFACMPMRVFVCYFLQTALNNCKLCI